MIKVLLIFQFISICGFSQTEQPEWVNDYDTLDINTVSVVYTSNEGEKNLFSFYSDDSLITNNLSGNLIFVQQAYHRMRQNIIETTPDHYPALAESVLAGEIPGSSAGGEQPKFTTYCREQSAHVIVKFSPKGDDPVARRWKDILITEHIASETLRETGLHSAAATQLIEKEGRLFLESKRFDRSGKHGRLSMLSLQVVDAEFTGLGEGWFPVVMALHQKGLINPQSVGEAALLWLFGRLINNTDMHLGNLSLGMEGDVFRLLPIYDMCSMGFAPKSGEVPRYHFNPTSKSLLLSTLNTLPHADLAIDEALKLAQVFWNSISQDSRISDEFKIFLERNNPLEGFDIP